MIIGIVGKPNVGKSAFFRSLTLADAPSGNFPFTTIDANKAMGYVKVEDPAKQFNKTSNPREGYVLENYRFVPIEIVDVAGLVPGAHEGKGLGNKFLDDLRQADALIHVIDLSGATNEKGEPIELNSYDPANDISFLEDELNHWFYNIISKHWENISKKIKMQGQKPEIAFTSVLSGLNVKEEQIIEALTRLNLDISNLGDNLFKFAQELRIITKPIIIAANKCDVLLENNLYETKLKKLKEQFPQYSIVPVMAEYEWNLKKGHESNIIKYVPGDNSFDINNPDQLSEQQKEGLEKIQTNLNQLNSTGVQDTLNKAVFDLLKLKPIFPGGSKLEDDKGNVLPDCFLMDEKATALDFAYKLHTDFGKNFIKAIDIKTKKMVGKQHPLNFGDIIEIVSGK